MGALFKIDFILARRMWMALMMSIFIPVLFFLLFSSIGIDVISDPIIKAKAIRNYLLTMTSFSMSGFGLFTLPMMLREDRNNNWKKFIKHSPLSMNQYYFSKMIQVLILFLFAIVVNFVVGIFIKHVEMSVQEWIGVACLLLFSGVFFIACGFIISQIKYATLATVIGNILYFVLAILGGSWMPVHLFPEWMQKIAEFTPTYHINQLLTEFVRNNQISFDHILVIVIYTSLLICATLFIQKRSEVK